MAVNKVEINGEVKLDLTQDTVTPETLLPGASAHNAAGDAIMGAAYVVRYDEPQNLTDEQQTQARNNIAAASSSHAAQHAAGGTDALLPQDIGAVDLDTFDALNLRINTSEPGSETVTLAPGEVAAYIAALPRLLTESLTIKITAGTVTATLDFTGFYGCGNIVLQTASGSQDVTLAGGVTAYRCAVKVNLIGMAITGGSSATKAAVSANDGGFMQLNSCTLTAGTGITRGVSTGTGSQVYLGNCSISGFATAIFAAHGSMVMPTDTSASGNTVGAQVWAGGIVLLGGSTPDALGGSSHVKNGGMIVKANGTLL